MTGQQRAMERDLAKQTANMETYRSTPESATPSRQRTRWLVRKASKRTAARLKAEAIRNRRKSGAQAH